VIQRGLKPEAGVRCCFGVTAFDDRIVAIGACTVCCSALQCLATCCRILPLRLSDCSSRLNRCDRCIYSVLQCVAVYGLAKFCCLLWGHGSSRPNCCDRCICSVLWCVAVFGNVLQDFTVVLESLLFTTELLRQMHV